MKDSVIKQRALEIIKSFPTAKNGQSFLTLRNGRKLFFYIFIKKYGLDGRKTKYTDQDVARRMRLVEFFDEFVKKHECKFKKYNQNKKKIYCIESVFYRMVIIDTTSRNNSKLELLSFYHFL